VFVLLTEKEKTKRVIISIKQATCLRTHAMHTLSSGCALAIAGMRE
jgi:hypothetical protein